MIEVQAPHPYAHLEGEGVRVFLAGSIEMGAAEEWQKSVIAACATEPVVFLNPRRRDWDNRWKQDKGHDLFREQVEWELQGLEDADLIVFYFDPATKSPVTLMELGLHAGRNPAKVIVCCPEGYWRKGNVDIVCDRYDVVCVASREMLVDALKKKIHAPSSPAEVEKTAAGG